MKDKKSKGVVGTRDSLTLRRSHLFETRQRFSGAIVQRHNAASHDIENADLLRVHQSVLDIVTSGSVIGSALTDPSRGRRQDPSLSIVAAKTLPGKHMTSLVDELLPSA